MTKTDELEKLQQKIEDFRDKRNWRQFHTPKNLAMALSVECAELVEIFQWMTPEQSALPDEATSAHIRQEIGDIMIYLSLISSSFGLDPLEAALEKMELNESRHPHLPAT
jgi:NTP pyrophosphatase (non-canonical NTP hydrolase)